MDFKKHVSNGLIAIGILSLTSLSGQAVAATTILGAQAAPISLTYGGSFSSPQNQFYDEYLFSIDTNSVDTITSTISLSSLLGINNLQTRLYSGTVTTTGTPDGLLQAWSTPITITGTGYSGTMAVINPITLSAGNYVLEVRGDVVGTAGGSYAGVLNISPIPEPGEWVLMLIGLGLVGFVATRRKQKNGGEFAGMAF
jgi:hypothetical protein